MTWFSFSPINYRFVIDAADHEKLEPAKSELRMLLDKPQLANIPVLVLGNKNDLPGALTVDQIIEVMYVPPVLTIFWRVEPLYSLQRADCALGRMLTTRSFLCVFNLECNRDLKQIASREVSCYSISAKNQVNIDVTLQWLTKKGKGK